jgi:hypothetical protein
MDVFLVPVGADRYELYCEEPDEVHETGAEPPRGFFRRLKHRFTEMLAEAERERRHGRSDHQGRGWLARLKGRMMRWVAESIAEQRLLWNLRRQTAATLIYPDDMPEPAAVDVMRKQLGRDFDKHQFWLALDSLAFVGSGLLMLVPGPNVLAYYFAFRLVGHYFSLRGARQGLTVVVWTHRPSVPLTELRRTIGLAPPEREQRVTAIAAALGLEHLSRFFERTAVPPTAG